MPKKCARFCQRTRRWSTSFRYVSWTSAVGLKERATTVPLLGAHELCSSLCPKVRNLRNVLEHLPDGQQPWVRAQMQRAYQAIDVRKATRLLTDLARRLETEYPSAAESLREGPAETLTVMGWRSARDCSGRSRRSIPLRT